MLAACSKSLSAERFLKIEDAVLVVDIYIHMCIYVYAHVEDI